MLCGRCRVFTRFYTILHEKEQISIITETFGIIPKISIGPESPDFLHVFRPTFGFYDKNFCHNRNFLQFYIKFLLRRKLRIAWHVLSRHTPPLIFVGNGVEYVCASNCTSDIKSENGFDHPHTTTSNVPTPVGMLLLYNRACPKGNGVLYVN